jgi:hypothetical protein
MNDNLNKKESATQCNMIAAWLEMGYSITSLEALKRFGCMRLASRIHDLKERGMNIDKKIITLANNKRVCEYFLVK